MCFSVVDLFLIFVPPRTKWRTNDAKGRSYYRGSLLVCDSSTPRAFYDPFWFTGSSVTDRGQSVTRKSPRGHTGYGTFTGGNTTFVPAQRKRAYRLRVSQPLLHNTRDHIFFFINSTEAVLMIDDSKKKKKKAQITLERSGCSKICSHRRGIELNKLNMKRGNNVRLISVPRETWVKLVNKLSFGPWPTWLISRWKFISPPKIITKNSTRFPDRFRFSNYLDDQLFQLFL